MGKRQTNHKNIQRVLESVANDFYAMEEQLADAEIVIEAAHKMLALNPAIPGDRARFDDAMELLRTYTEEYVSEFGLPEEKKS